MPERIRSVGFAFLGLTAAAGLALVAIFAQMGFPLLSPAPLPSGPSEPSSVSNGVAVEQGPVTAGRLALSQGAPAAPDVSGGEGGAGGATGDDRAVHIDRSSAPVSDSPAGDPPAGSEQVTTSPPAVAPDPAPEPTTTTESTPPPDEVPVSSPGTGAKPDKPANNPEAGRPESTPAAKPSKPAAKPVQASSAKAKAATAARQAKPVATPAAAASSAPAAVGQDKAEKDKEEKKDK